jgi:uncharacterized RDD family membrane protein YckC
LRTAAQVLDIILIAAVVEILPRAGFFAGLAYLLLSDGLFDGRSIGKKLIKLKVVSSESQQPCTFRGSILRNSTFALGYLLWLIPWIGWIFIIIVSVLELILVLGSKEGKRLGDEFARTSVIEEN